MDVGKRQAHQHPGVNKPVDPQRPANLSVCCDGRARLGGPTPPAELLSGWGEAGQTYLPAAPTDLLADGRPSIGSTASGKLSIKLSFCQ